MSVQVAHGASFWSSFSKIWGLYVLIFFSSLNWHSILGPVQGRKPFWSFRKAAHGCVPSRSAAYRISPFHPSSNSHFIARDTQADWEMCSETTERVTYRTESQIQVFITLKFMLLADTSQCCLQSEILLRQISYLFLVYLCFVGKNQSTIHNLNK